MTPAIIKVKRFGLSIRHGFSPTNMTYTGTFTKKGASGVIAGFLKEHAVHWWMFERSEKSSVFILPARNSIQLALENELRGILTAGMP